MRKRKTEGIAFEGVLDDDSASDSSCERNIAAVDPEERNLLSRFTEQMKSGATQYRSNINTILKILLNGNVWWVQILTIIVAAVLTYSYANTSSTGTHKINVQHAIMTIIVLVGASPLCKTHLSTAAIGAFAGGHGIIGSIGLQNSSLFGPQDITLSSYLWLVVLASVAGLIWCFFINSHLKILDGYAGRLGTTAFISMNLVMLTLYGPLKVVDWNRYYYGFIQTIHVAEEDSSPIPIGSAWNWIEEAELAVGYTLGVLWVGVVGGATRVIHDKAVENDSASLNNILFPVVLALFSMLIVNMTQYQHAAGLYNGFAVGSYVAMASLQKITSIAKFATVSLVAAFWGLALTPFFTGFAGKSGFTAMMGHVTHNRLERIVRHLHFLNRQEDQRQTIQPAQKGQREQTQKEPTPQSPSRKMTEPKEAFYTKQQRRQQQRLQHQRKLKLQQENSTPDQKNETQSFFNSQQEVQPLHHRAWSALPRIGDSVWQHPLDEESNNLV